MCHLEMGYVFPFLLQGETSFSSACSYRQWSGEQGLILNSNPFHASLATRKKDEMCLLKLRGEPYCLDDAWHETGWEHPDVLGAAGVACRCPHCNAAELT